KGVPTEGLDTRVAGEFAGLGVRSSGRLVMPAEAMPSYRGTLAAAADTIAPLARLAGLDLPGVDARTALRLDGEIGVDADSIDLDWNKGSVADRLVTGKIKVSPAAGGRWQ